MNLKDTHKGVSGKARTFILIAGLFLSAHFPSAALAQGSVDAVTGFPREPIPVTAWPGGRKVAVSFALFVEVFGFGQGPVFRPDLASRNPDLVNEAFRQYAITWGNLRVGRLFKELDVPLTVVLNAGFLRALSGGVEGVSRGQSQCSDHCPRHQQQQRYPAAWARAHRTEGLYPSDAGLDRLDHRHEAHGLVESERLFQWRHDAGDGVEGITYNIDQMDSDFISRLKTPDGPLILLPYPTPTVDMGQFWRG